MKTKTQFKRKFSFLILPIFLAGSLLISSCGKNPEQGIVKDVDIHTELREGDVWLTLGAVFKLGAASLTDISFPVVDPQDSSIKYGEVSFRPQEEEGLNEIRLSFNLSSAAQVEGGLAKLPNGEDLPIAGVDTSNVLQLDIAQINSRIYLALNSEQTVLGFAIAIKEFGKIGDTLSGANLFLGFDIKGVIGSVGLFTGDEPLENGLGFFVDLSSVFTTDMINDIIAGKEISEESFSEMKISARSNNQLARSKTRENFQDEGNTPRNMLGVAKEVDEFGARTLRFVPKDN